MIHRIDFPKKFYKQVSKSDRRTTYLRQYYRWKKNPDFEIINHRTKSQWWYFALD